MKKSMKEISSHYLRFDLFKMFVNAVLYLLYIVVYEMVKKVSLSFCESFFMAVSTLSQTTSPQDFHFASMNSRKNDLTCKISIVLHTASFWSW